MTPEYADYDFQLTETETVIRLNDGANIPNDPRNTDRIFYNEWLAAGFTPVPYDPPEPAPAAPSAEQQILFDHENRIRVQEGKPPLTLDAFTKAAKI